MLGKLLKHEFKVTSRYFLPMFLVIIIATALLKVSTLLSENSIFLSIEISTFLNIVEGLFIAVYLLILFGTAMLALFLLVKRFYSNMFGDEGYLTHTLPVTGTQLLNSKLICSFVWMILLVPIWIGSILILFAGTDAFSDISFYAPMVLEEVQILNISGFSVGIILVELILMFLFGLIGAILSYYLCITLGQHFLGEHRLAGAILFYFVISVISSTVSSVFSTIIEMTLGNPSAIVTIPALFQVLTIMFGASILITLVQIVVYYLITNYLLTKRLNLY